MGLKDLITGKTLEALLWKSMGMLVFIAIGFGLGCWATSAFYSPRVSALETKIGSIKERADSFEQAYSDVAAAAQKQNDGLIEMASQKLEREKRAKDAAEKAEAKSATYQAQATAIMQSQPPSGADECAAAAAASAAFDAELKSERGKNP